MARKLGPSRAPKETPEERAERLRRWREGHAKDLELRRRQKARGRALARGEGSATPAGRVLRVEHGLSAAAYRWAAGKRRLLAHRFPRFACGRCGAEESPAIYGDPATAARLVDAGRCWSCDFWAGVDAEVREVPLAWVIDAGRAWRLGPPAASGPWIIERGPVRLRVAWVIEVGTVPPAWSGELPDTGTVRQVGG